MTSVLPLSPAQYYSNGLRGRFQLDAHRAIAQPSQGYEDIEYEFDDAKYAARTKAVLCAGGLEKEVPRGFPTSVSGPMVWSGVDFSEDDYVVQLSEKCRAEIKTALRYFRCKLAYAAHPILAGKLTSLAALGLSKDRISMANFPLPTLGPRLQAIRGDVYEGRGFSILRGLDVDSYSEEDIVLVYLGTTSYVAETRGKQNQRGDMLGMSL